MSGTQPSFPAWQPTKLGGGAPPVQLTEKLLRRYIRLIRHRDGQHHAVEAARERIRIARGERPCDDD